ncbi:hypothetical protein DFH08DRAFT_796757 [Mycena albidolilacea]|uniref:Uncharacterized protein n=1 Tax=Mycena albidolilacea TaxID=1033008 RepID=A0AAD7F531_9AGAR|nr:hypothetical protein DFH08DRAFT_796757 [Mycena albidolilacea]
MVRPTHLSPRQVPLTHPSHPAPNPKSTRSSSKPTNSPSSPPSPLAPPPKAEVLDALKDDITSALGDELPPRPTQTGDFELCRALKDTRGRPTGEYELLEDGKVSLRDAGVANWEALFLQFRDAETGDLRPVEYVPYEDDDDAPPAPAPASAPSAAAATAETSTSRGKRKARPD